MTFRELFLKVSPYEEMRIYDPNRECLIWETFLKVHSSHNLIRQGEYITWDTNSTNDYFYHNEAIRQLRSLDNLDEQTKLFLEKYADYEVHGIETGGYYTGDFTDPEINPGKHQPCLDVFICMPDPLHERECERCHHSEIAEDKTAYRGWRAIPDKDDAECKKCWRNK